LKKERELGYDD